MFPGTQRPDLRVETARLGAVDGAPSNGVARRTRERARHGTGLVDDVVVNEPLVRERQPHLGEQIAGVQRDDVAAERRFDPELAAFAEGEPAHPHVELGFRRDRHPGARFGEHPPVGVVERVAVHVHLIRAEQPVGVHLLDAARHHGTPDAAGMRDLAGLVGISPEHLSRLLRQLADEGLICRSKGWIIVTDVRKLGQVLPLWSSLPHHS